MPEIVLVETQFFYQISRDDQSLNFRRTLVNLRDPRVSVVAFRRHIRNVTVNKKTEINKRKKTNKNV